MKKIEYSFLEKIGVCFYLSEDHYNGYIRHCKFRCHCGVDFTASISNVKFNKQSCGCIKDEVDKIRNRSHGLSRLNGKVRPEYSAYHTMKSRCYRKKDNHYQWYGARGIKVCDRWLESFENFIADMGLKPSPNLSLDRIDNNGNYEPSNCKWVTHKEQCNNRRSNLKYKQ